MSVQIQFPVGRVIACNIYDGQPQFNDDKTPKLDQAGIQRVDYKIGVAIPKTPGQQWWESDWGKKLYAVGVEGHPQFVASPSFSWKVQDGDQNTPNTLGNIPCQQVGYAGNWIIWMSNGLRKPQICDASGVLLFEKNHVYAGCYVQTICNVSPNTATGNQKRGVYVNLEAVCFIGHGERIVSDAIDVKSVQWSTQLPPGASVTPIGPSATPTTAGAPSAMSQPAPTALPPVPNMAILQPPAPVHVPKKVMIGAASGFTYEQMIGAGWTEEALLLNNMMVIQ